MGLGRVGQGLGFPGACVCRPHRLGACSVPSLCQPVWETEGNMNTFQEKYQALAGGCAGHLHTSSLQAPKGLSAPRERDPGHVREQLKH